jgi:hypothetical protein
VAREGREYFRSTPVQGPPCLRQPERKGRGHSSPLLVGATRVRAGAPQVLPLDGEAGRNATADSTPPDCELTAAKRRIARRRQEHPQLAQSVIGDALSAHAPCVEQLRPQRQHDVVVAKPTSHPTLMAAVAAAEGAGQWQTGQWSESPGAQQRPSTSRLGCQAPVALESAVRVNYLAVWERNAGGELRSHKSWITELAMDATHGAVVVQIGRTRGKIENEQCNVHKNHGSELTHHAGHGQQRLAMVFSLVNLLAYVAPTVLALGDRLSQRCRTREARREVWKALRTLVTLVLVESWPHLLARYLDAAEASP